MTISDDTTPTRTPVTSAGEFGRSDPGSNAQSDPTPLDGKPAHDHQEIADGGVVEELDPFDPDRLRLTQDFASSLGVKKALLTVPVRREPAKEWWVRRHPDPSFRLETAVLELKEDRELYLVAPELRPDLAPEATFGLRTLFTTINRQGVVFLWPVRLPGPDGRIDEWSRSLLEAATMAADQWVRVVSNMSLGAYEVFTATGDLPEPKWSDEPFAELLKTAFKDRYIETFDHPVIKRLRGEE